MNDSRFGAFAAAHFAGYEANAAGAAVAGAAIMGQVDAVAKGGVEQQLAAAREKAFAIDRDLVTSCHCLIPEIFEFSICGWWGRSTAASLPAILRKACVLDLKHRLS
jgi:hypothetical protein